MVLPDPADTGSESSITSWCSGKLGENTRRNLVNPSKRVNFSIPSGLGGFTPGSFHCPPQHRAVTGMKVWRKCITAEAFLSNDFFSRLNCFYLPWDDCSLRFQFSCSNGPVKPIRNHLRTDGLEQRVPLGSQEWASIESGLFAVWLLLLF